MRDYTEFSTLGTEYLQPKQKRIGLLGGTFNPVHNGHIEMANIALYEFLLGEVIFLPVGKPPHKSDDFVASAEHRLKMLKLATANENRFSVSCVEVDREGTTYTIDTLEMLSRKDKNASFYFIIGSDTLFELKTWRSLERVMLLTDFICVMRPGQDEFSVRSYARILNAQYGNKIYLANERGSNVSSSQIRALAAKNKLCKGLVPESVANYITQHRIYIQRGADA